MARQIAVPEMIVPADEYDLGGLNPFDLSGRHALVTGATRPLARAVARALAEAGARISVTTLDGGPAELAVADSILEEGRALGRAGVARELDLTDANAVDAAVEEIEAEIGSIDILVHAVQEANIKPVLAASLEDWRRELDRNVTSLFVTTQAVGRRMVERGYGRITTFSSVLHDRGIPHASLFGASQGAIVGYTRSLGLEWGRNGVTVNTVTLGFFDGVPGPQADPEIASILERYIPLRRLGTPSDVGGVVVYLSSEFAAFVDSESLVVDGAIAVHA